MALLPNPSPVEPPQYTEMVQYSQQGMVSPCQPGQQPTMTMISVFLVPAGMTGPIMVPILCHGAVPSPMLDYVKLMEQIKNSTDKETQNVALNMLRGHILVASRHPEGCRAVQAAFDVAPKPLLSDFARELHGHVYELIQSPSGNYVIQKVIEVLPTSEYSFVLSELARNGEAVAQHRFGCRIFCRLLEHSEGTPSQELDLLLDELLVDVVEACKAPFAHYAVDAVLEHGTHVQRRQIGEALKGNLWKLANHKHASHIIDKTFGMGEEYCPIDIQLELVQELILEGPEALEALATKKYGVHVMIALAKFVRTQAQQLDEQCLRIWTQLAQSRSLARAKRGQRFLQDI